MHVCNCSSRFIFFRLVYLCSVWLFLRYMPINYVYMSSLYYSAFSNTQYLQVTKWDCKREYCRCSFAFSRSKTLAVIDVGERLSAGDVLAAYHGKNSLMTSHSSLMTSHEPCCKPQRCLQKNHSERAYRSPCRGNQIAPYGRLNRFIFNKIWCMERFVLSSCNTMLFDNSTHFYIGCAISRNKCGIQPIIT